MAVAVVTRGLLLAPVLVTLLQLGTGWAEPPPPAAIPTGRLDIPEWKARHEAKVLEARSRQVDLVLLGDSITEQYEFAGPEPFLDFSSVWQRFYAGRHALNLGFSGDGTPHLLWRVMHGEIDGIAPKVAMILIGANNIGWLNWSAADTVNGIEAVVIEVHRRLPATKILLVGVLPSDRGALVAQETAEINTALAARYGDGALPAVTFRDVSASFLKDGAVDSSLFRDPQQTAPEPALHPSPKGQARLAAALEPTLSALLEDHPLDDTVATRSRPRRSQVRVRRRSCARPSPA